jgi:GT2 family glycosyltransferase
MPNEPGSRIAVIIPTWKRGDLLRKCLESLRRQTFTDFEIVIVSNGAGEWADSLAKEFDATLVRFAENRGFAAAINAGIAASQSPFVLLLNDDAELDPSWLQKTTALLQEKPEISFCCGKIFQADGRTIDNAGDALSMGGGAWRLGYGRPDSPEFDIPKPLIAVSLTAALFRRTVFEKIGVLDENFISYLEDMDFSIRLWRAGLRGLYLPQATARHHGGASSDGAASRTRFRVMTRNQLALLAKHYPASLWLRLAPRIKWAQTLWFGMAVRKGLLSAYLAGLWQYISLLHTGLLPQCIRNREPWSKDELRSFVAWLRESERAIYEDISARPREQQDTYWRMYFALFRPKRAAPEAVAVSHQIDPEGKHKAGPSSFHSSG